MVFVVIARGAEFDVLWVVGIPEADFGCCVEATDDVVEVVDEFRVGEEDWQGLMSDGWMEGGTKQNLRDTVGRAG